MMCHCCLGVQGIFSRASGSLPLLPQLQFVFEETAAELAAAATSAPLPPSSKAARSAAPLAGASIPVEVGSSLRSSKSPTKNPGLASGVNAATEQLPVQRDGQGSGKGAANGSANVPPNVISVEEAGRSGASKAPWLPKPSTVTREGSIDLDFDDSDEEMEELEMEGPHNAASTVSRVPKAVTGPSLGSRAATSKIVPSSGPPHSHSEAASDIGPSLGPDRGAASMAGPQQQPSRDTMPETAVPPLRMVGPARPPAELLAAAQEAALAVNPDPPFPPPFLPLPSPLSFHVPLLCCHGLLQHSNPFSIQV